jgi:putative molybdopterin biosynthesis protein
VTRERFFDQGIQYFLSLVHEKAFLQAAERLEGYDVSKSGKMIFPHELESEAELKSS